MKAFILFIMICLNTNADELKYHSFSAPILNSAEILDLSKSNKKILINFWATWCTSCIEEIPILEALKNDPKNKDIEFIAISVGDNAKKIAKFIKKHGFSYKIVKDEDKTISNSWGVKSLPQTVVIENQKIIYQATVPPKQL